MRHAKLPQSLNNCLLLPPPGDNKPRLIDQANRTWAECDVYDGLVLLAPHHLSIRNAPLFTSFLLSFLVLGSVR